MMVARDRKLVKSRFVQVVEGCEKVVIWHSLFGNPRVISKDTLELLNFLSTPHSLASICAEYDIGKDGEDIVQELVAVHHIVPVDFSEREFLANLMRQREKAIISGSLVDKLQLTISEACNFRCKYCLYFANLGTSDRIASPEKFMTLEVAKRAVDEYLAIQRRHGRKLASITFGGGEPLLSWSVIEQTIEYLMQVYGSEFELSLSINTNASLITSAIARKIKKYRINVGSSLDGLRESNDIGRRTSRGGKTFDSIVKGFKNLEAQGVPIDVAITVTQDNFKFIDERVIDWAVERRMDHLRINPDEINMIAIPMEDIVVKLMNLWRYAKARGVGVTGSWTRPLANLNDSVLDTPIAFCAALYGGSICVNPSGNVYGCSYSNVQLGTIFQMTSYFERGNRYHLFVKDHLTGEVAMCNGCIIEGQCGGGCKIAEEFADATQTAKPEQSCELYRRMTKELLFEQLAEVESDVKF